MNDSKYRFVLRLFFALTWFLVGIRFEDKSRLAAAGERLDTAFGDQPDMDLRVRAIQAPSDMAIALGGALTIGGFFAAQVMGVWPVYAGVIGGFALVGAGSAGAPRYMAARKDRQAWIDAGSPDSWAPSARSTPTDVDLLVWATGAALGAGLGYLVVSGT